MRDFASTWNSLLKYCIPIDFLLTVALAQNALRKELLIAPFVEHINKATLGKFNERFW